MYRVQASCRKHTSFHSMLALLLREHKWRLTIDEAVCKIEADFDSMNLAQEAKQRLQSDIRLLERRIRPTLGYGLIFSNAYWVNKQPKQGVE